MTADVPVFEAKLTNCQTFSASMNKYYGEGPEKFLDVFSEQEMELWQQWCLPVYDKYDDIRFGPVHWNHSMIQRDILRLLSTVTPAHKCPKNNTDDEVEEGRILISMGDDNEDGTIEIYGLWCEPVYSLTRRTVTNVSDTSRGSYQIHVSPDVKEDLELGTTQDAITSYIVSSLDDLIGGSGEDGELWQVFLYQSEPQRSPMDFRNASLMEKVSKRVWSQFSALAVEKGCKSPASERRIVPGTAISTETRLCIQTLSLRLMESLLGLLMLSSILLTFCVSPPPLHRDPGSMATHALEIARNPSIRDYLQGCGGLSERMLRRYLHGCKLLPNPSMEARCQQSSVISVEPQCSTAEWTKTDTTSSSSAWWHSTGLTWWLRGFIISAAVGVAIALQVLILLSRKNNGLANVDPHGYQKYTWTYIPTLILASLGLAFSLADSNARVLHPFQLLRKGGAALGDTTFDPAAHISLFSVLTHWKR